MKPECRDALQEIQRFLDGEMEGPEHERLDAHLHECDPCMQRAEFKRSVKSLVADRCGCDEVPPELAQRLRSFLDAPPSDAPLA